MLNMRNGMVGTHVILRNIHFLNSHYFECSNKNLSLIHTVACIDRKSSHQYNSSIH